jgi:hypothetical protein
LGHHQSFLCLSSYDGDKKNNNSEKDQVILEQGQKHLIQALEETKKPLLQRVKGKNLTPGRNNVQIQLQISC